MASCPIPTTAKTRPHGEPVQDRVPSAKRRALPGSPSEARACVITAARRWSAPERPLDPRGPFEFLGKCVHQRLVAPLPQPYVRVAAVHLTLESRAFVCANRSLVRFDDAQVDTRQVGDVEGVVQHEPSRLCFHAFSRDSSGETMYSPLPRGWSGITWAMPTDPRPRPTLGRHPQGRAGPFWGLFHFDESGTESGSGLLEEAAPEHW